MKIDDQPCFLYACALVKMLLREAGSAELGRFLAGKEPHYTTSLCFGEALGVLKRKWTHKEISQEEYMNAAHILRAWITSHVINLLPIDITDLSTFFEAADLSRRYAPEQSRLRWLRWGGNARKTLAHSSGDNLL
jgi:hypothetical protein